MAGPIDSVFCAALIIFLVDYSAGFQCRDGNGKPVDWFVLYKLPEGTDFVYLTPDNPSWTASKYGIDGTTNNPMSNTLQQIYKQESNTRAMSYFYNDEKPSHGITEKYGHTKGVLAFELNTDGFWIVHSVPKFPDNGTYNYPTSGHPFGQTLMCVTYSYNHLNDIAEALLYNNPWPYGVNIPADFTTACPNLALLADRESKTGHSIINLPSKGGQKIMAFAKSKDFGKDLYAALVAPTLQSNLYVETWGNGKGKLTSSCDTEYKVENVEHMEFKRLRISFKHTQDHSKWAVTSSNGHDWACVGDINRMETQLRRSGGTVCLQFPGVHKAFYQIVDSLEKCKSENDLL